MGKEKEGKSFVGDVVMEGPLVQLKVGCGSELPADELPFFWFYKLGGR